MLPKPGDIVAISHNVACHAMTARVISVDTDCWEGMAFLQVYELDEGGEAIERRMAYVALATISLSRRPDPRCTCPYTSRRSPHRMECRRRHFRKTRQGDIDDRMKQQANRGLTRPPAIPRPRKSPETTTTTGSPR